MSPSGTHNGAAAALPGPAYSVVIPCYNSAATIAELLTRLDAVFGQMESSYEILAVDDASPDRGTWPAILAAGRGLPLRAFQFTRNFGRTAAVLCGMEQARGDWIIVMDDDLQHRPEDIPRLAELGDHDAVVADFPYRERHHSLAQRATSRFRNWFETSVLGKPRHIRMSPFIMLRAEIAKMMLMPTQLRPYFPALLLHVTRDVVAVHAAHAPRSAGQSGFGFRARLGMFSNLIFNNSALPLRGVAVMGSALAALAILAGFYLTLTRLLSQRNVPGWTSIIVVELFLGGALLLSLGIVGEYLARIIQLGEQRPPYLVRASHDESADVETAGRDGAGRLKQPSASPAQEPT
jgi:dolichol-phosphate mannosyltransferase/undecaprenyl-phosphate 4-deoxy-4-formamido-L-arabinose transferase